MKANSKHKIQIAAHPKVAEFFNKHALHSIRNKVLQRLVLVWMNAWTMSSGSSLYQALDQRLKARHLIFDKCNFAYLLSPEDVMSLLHCSKRTAREYIDALRFLEG